MTEPATDTLDVPGAVLTYDVHQPETIADHRPLLIVGSPMAASGFAQLVPRFTDRKVIACDPRGMERSGLLDGGEVTVEIHGDDVHRVWAGDRRGMSMHAKLYMPCRRWLIVVSTEGQVIPETAGEHMARAVPVAGPADTIGAIRSGLGGRRFETATAVAVCDEGRLIGLLRIEDLLAASEEVLASEAMDPNPPVVGPGIDQERATWYAVQSGEATLAVVDQDRLFLGFIPPSNMLKVLLWEHDEDMARLGGFVHNAEVARTASQEPVLRRYWHRLPWVLLGLVGALLAAGLMGTFERELEANVLLAFFIPGIVYMADAVGTQTETLIIRGLSVGVTVRQVVKRELLTGVLVGVTVAIAFYPLALWRWGDLEVAVSAALALLAACSTATVVAMALPYLLNRLGKDPAYGSGPLATVIQDLASILIYFAISTAIIG